MADGVIIIDKPKGWTSFDVVAKLRRLYATKKIGHTGTLDPMATGVLCVFIGNATRFISLLPCNRKRYVAEINFGFTTDTGDVTGVVNSTTELLPAKDEILKVLPQFIGTIRQTPPVYSAIKVGGKALYRYAREGKKVVVPSREVVVNSIDLLDFTPHHAVLEIDCGAGTYIRSLVQDIAQVAKSAACLCELRRTVSGCFNLNSAVTIEQIAALPCPDDMLLSVETGFSEYSLIDVDRCRLKRLQNGLDIEVEAYLDSEFYRVYCEKEFFGVARCVENRLKAVRLCRY